MAILFIACDDSEIDNGQQGQIVTFSSGIDEYTTRVNADGDGWVAGDSVGVYMLNNGQSGVISENAKHTATTAGRSTTFSTENMLYYPTDGSAVDFIGYHPYSTKVAGMKYPVNLTDQKNQMMLDLMYADSKVAKNDGYTQTHGSAVMLTFNHMLSKVVLNVTLTDVSGEAEDMTAVIKGMDRTAEFDLSSGIITSQSSNGDIVPATTATGYEAILLPLESLTANHTVEFTLGGKTYVWVISKNTVEDESGSITKFRKGCKYTFYVKISNSGVTATAVATEGSVTPWNDGGTGSGEAGEKEDEGEEPEGPQVGDVDPTALYGYGAGTTGGEGATAANIFHFNDGTCFAEWLKLREKNKSAVPAIVWLSGEFTTAQGRNSMFDVKRTSNITFIGTDGFKMNKVGIFAKEANNIIFRNLHIILPPYSADGLSMQESSQIWVDHCTFESTNQTKDAEDGSCDITHGTYNVTVSWCKFIQTQKSCLVGHSDGNGSEDKNIKVTFHHNHFQNSGSRHPRLRFGTAHVYNNFYDNVTTYGAGSAYGAMLLLEDNYFDGVKLPTDICTFPAKKSGSSWVSNLTGSVAGYLYERNNTYANKPADANEFYPMTNVEYTAYGKEDTKLATPFKYEDFKPAYSYIVDNVEQIPSILSSSTGVGKLSGYAQAPIEVNNGGFTPGESGGEEGEGEGEGEEGETPITLENDWFVIGYNAATASTSLGQDGAITITGTGKMESGKQAMAYVYRTIEGDFTIAAKLSSAIFNVEKNLTQAHVGLMLTPDISASGTELLYATASYAADSKYYSAYRITAAVNRGTKTLPAATGDGDVYLKLERNGSTYSSSYSLDGGVTYSNATSQTFAAELPATINVGFVVSSGDAGINASATFSDIKINGNTAPSFTE